LSISLRDAVQPDGKTHEIRGEIRLTRAVIALTFAAVILPAINLLGGLAVCLQTASWVTSLGQLLFITLVSCLIGGVFVYQLTRLGYLKRLVIHQPASDEALGRFYRESAPPAVTILVPSYKENGCVPPFTRPSDTMVRICH